ncbi:MAG: DUF5681 domain-containing protein, partial [Planctomycetota bacterium]
RGLALSDLLRKKLGEKIQSPGGRTVTRGELVAEALVTLAVAGDLDAIKLVFDRLEGRVPIDPPNEEFIVVRYPVAIPPTPPAAAQAAPGQTIDGQTGPARPRRNRPCRMMKSTFR